MYIPRLFAEPDRDALHGFIERYPLGALVTASSEHGFYATHLPLLLDRARGAFGVLQVPCCMLHVGFVLLCMVCHTHIGVQFILSVADYAFHVVSRNARPCS